MEAKTMRKHIAIILAIFAAVFFLGGCGSTPTPTETTDTFLQALKAQDAEKMATVYEESDLDLLEVASESDDESSDESTDAGLEAVYEDQMLPEMISLMH